MTGIQLGLQIAADPSTAILQPVHFQDRLHVPNDQALICAPRNQKSTVWAKGQTRHLRCMAAERGKAFAVELQQLNRIVRTCGGNHGAVGAEGKASKTCAASSKRAVEDAIAIPEL